MNTRHAILVLIYLTRACFINGMDAQTTKQLATNRQLIQRLYRGEEIGNILHRYGTQADPNAYDETPFPTPAIIIAFFHNHPALEKLLSCQRIKINATAPNGDTLLCLATNKGSALFNRLVIRSDIDINQGDPLKKALCARNYPFAAQLLKKGANITEEATQLIEVIFQENNSIPKELFYIAANDTLLCRALHTQNLTLFTLLMTQKNADVETGKPLRIACAQNNHNAVALLCGQGAQIEKDMLELATDEAVKRMLQNP